MKYLVVVKYNEKGFILIGKHEHTFIVELDHIPSEEEKKTLVSDKIPLDLVYKIDFNDSSRFINIKVDDIVKINIKGSDAIFDKVKKVNNSGFITCRTGYHFNFFGKAKRFKTIEAEIPTNKEKQKFLEEERYSELIAEIDQRYRETDFCDLTTDQLERILNIIKENDGSKTR